MKNASLLFTSLIIGIALMSSCNDEPDTEPEDQNENNTFDLLEQSPSLPEEPYRYLLTNLPAHFNTPQVNAQNNEPASNALSNAGATLGRVLFYDKHLSLNNTIACASCHLQENAFSDPKQFSEGFEGGKTARNSMGLSNSRYYASGAFFWDERAATLEDQTLMPIQDHIEMGMDLGLLEEKLAEVPYYAGLFSDAFGDETISADRISKALAQFVRSMVSFQSPFDDGVEAIGNQDLRNTDFPNYTTEENAGKRLFFSNRTNCGVCHGTVNFVDDVLNNNGLDVEYADNGVGEITGNANQNALFKVGSLRNVELTAPYMHDGRFATLEEVVEHYNSGIAAHPNLSPPLRQGGPGRPGPVTPIEMNLSEAEKASLVSFLKTLTDDKFIADERFADPFQ